MKPHQHPLCELRPIGERILCQNSLEFFSDLLSSWNHYLKNPLSPLHELSFPPLLESCFSDTTNERNPSFYTQLHKIKYLIRYYNQLYIYPFFARHQSLYLRELQTYRESAKYLPQSTLISTLPFQILITLIQNSNN